MSKLAPDPTDLFQLIAPRIADVAGAADLADLRGRAEEALRAIAPGHSATIVWARDGAAMGSPGGPAAHYPLRAGDDLVGWITLEPGGRSAEQEQWLGLLAAVLAPTAAVLRAQASGTAIAARQLALRDSINGLRRAISPEALLRELSALIKAHVPFQHIYWVLRYRESEWAGIGYASLGDSDEWPRLYWRASAGLSGAVMAGGAPIYTESYGAECARRGVTPLYDERLGESHAWYGVPLSDGGRVFGAMVAYSNTVGVELSAEDRALLAWLAEETSHAVRGAQRYERAAEEASQRAALNLIARQINQSLDPDDVPALIVERAPTLLSAEEASLLLLDETTNELVFRYAAGPAGHSLLGRRLPAGEGVAGFVASSGEPSIVNDTSADGRFYGDLDGASGFKTRSIVAVPLRGIDGVRGVIEVLNRRDNAPFTEQDRVLLDALADQAVIALENAQKFASKERALARRAQELDRSNDRLVKILRASNALRAERPIEEILDQIAGLVVESFGFQRAMIALVRRERGAEPALQVVATAGFAPARPAAERVPLAGLAELLRPEFRRGSLTYLVERRLGEQIGLWNERAARPQAQAGGWHQDDALLVLLRDSRGEISGVIALGDPDDGNQPSAEQVQILEILANQAAAATENAHLYAGQQHSLSRMMALNGLGRAISTTLRSPQQIYELTASGMLEMSGAGWATVFLDEAAGTPFRQTFHTGAAPAAPASAAALAREVVAGRRPLSRRPGREREGLLAIPLLGSSRCLGAICVGYADALPDAGDVESLILFASQAASAVESLLLLGEVRLGRDQLASIMASTREGMLLVGDDGRVEVANSAFFHLAEAADWLSRPGAPADLADLAVRDLLWQWQTTSSFPAAELEQLHSGIAAVADGLEGYMVGQLNGMAPGASALEWSILRATPEGAADDADAGARRRWPILLTVRDITAAKEAERLRSDLTNMMVHDLRSPLSSIISSIDLIFRGVTGEVSRQQRDVLTIAYASTQKLLNMINLLLDISRLEGGRMPLDLSEIGPRELADAAFANMQVLAETKGVALRAELDGAPGILADKELVLRVLQNLLDNALKFSPKGSAVVLSAAAAPGDPGLVCLAVRDTGVGIKAQDLEQIFTKFGQAGNRRNAGSGLGLTFCKLVVETHGGRIWVESEPGQGSTFFFTLPAASPA